MKIKKISLRSLNDNAMNDIEPGHLLGGNEYGCYRIIKYLLSFLILTAVFPANAQRKDTDAKVALWNFKKCRERKETVS